MKGLLAVIEKEGDAKEIKAALETFQQTHKTAYAFPDFPEPAVRERVVRWLLKLVDEPATEQDIRLLALEVIKITTRCRDGLQPLTELKALKSVITAAVESKNENAKISCVCTLQNVLFLGLTSNPSYKAPALTAMRDGELYKPILAMWTAENQYDIKINCQRIIDHLTYNDLVITKDLLNNEKILAPLINTFLAYSSDMSVFTAATDTGNQQRVVCTHVLRLLVKFFIYIVENESNAASGVKFDKTPIGAATYDAFCSRLVALLGHGAVPPANPFGLKQGGTAASGTAAAASTATAAAPATAVATATAAAPAAATATTAAAAATPQVAGSNDAKSAPAATAAPTTVPAANASGATANTPATTTTTTATAAGGKAAPPTVDDDPDEKNPNRASLWSVKGAIADLLLALPKTVVPEVMKMGTPFSMQGLVDLLYRQSVRALKGIREADMCLPPICIALTNVAKGSAEARLFLKVAVFGKYATTKERNADNMLPVGAVNPHVLDEANPYSLKCNLLKHLTSFQSKLKVSVSEFLYEICSADSDEFIRLVGFGNAAGTLADKGFPGLAGMKAKAIDLDALVAASKPGGKKL